ncbi:MAG TPA: exodeoxyribonuclease VII large subunit [Hyphomicrobiaceae bacterium]|nr:exodeoxyribonuclease VII large subunit [Hyphomicrobiaceae bacterium]
MLAAARPDEENIHQPGTPQKLWKGATSSPARAILMYHRSDAEQSQRHFVADLARTSRQDTRPGANLPELTVSELSASIRRTLEGAFGYVRLRGEISGFRGAHASGHCYFALKDDKAKIEAVIWRSTVQSLKLKPVEGLEVVVTGRVTTYPGSSKYQIVIDALEPAGVGALMALLEERKRKLAAEGLFDEARKKPLPFFPRTIGIVTSPTGAVIRDMLAGFAERFPVRVLLWPVRVQGETCAGEVAAAIRGFNALPHGGPLPRPDVLIVARGGGSLEDLWGFNDETVVRAAAASAIPLVSAVGHETDWTLIDLAADARAPTPTKAAEWAVPRHSELREQTGKLGLRLATAARRALDAMRAHLRAAMRGLPRLGDLLALPRQRFDAVDRRLGRALLANTRAHGMRLARSSSRLGPRLLDAQLRQTRHRLDVLARRADAALARRVGPRRARLERVAGRLSPQPIADRVGRCGARLAELEGRMRQSTQALLAARRRHLEGCSKLLASLGYHGVLQRGYALLRDSAGRTLRSAADIVSGQRLDIEMADGRVDAQVLGTSVRDADKRPAPARAAPRTKPGTGSGGQGSLF